MASPQQEIFTLCRQVVAQVIGEKNTYDYLPPEGVAYPFVFVGEQYGRDVRTKSAILGVVNQTIHVYHNDHRRRGSTTKIMNDILTEMRKQDRTRSFFIDLRGVDMRVLTDNTTSTPLLHGVLDLEFKFH